jgi:succinyl-CoA synthetase alpha subunit
MGRAPEYPCGARSLGDCRCVESAQINVCFAGITGWTASAIVAVIDDAGDLTLTSGVSRSAAGQNLATATGSASHGSVYATVAEALESAAVDVLVDYTSAAAVKSNVWTAVEAEVHVVIGSSGLTSDDYEELDRLARDRGVGVIAAGDDCADWIADGRQIARFWRSRRCLPVSLRLCQPSMTTSAASTRPRGPLLNTSATW